MPKYKFQFETGHLYDGPTEIVVKDFTAEIKKVSPSLAAVIEARWGGQLVSELLRVGSYPAVTAKRRKTKPVKRTKKEEVSK